MVVRTHKLLWSIAFVLFAGISVLMHPAIGLHGLSGQYFYKHPKLGFSLEYPLPLTAREFPNGVELNNDAVQINDRIHIDVTNTTLEPDRYYVERIAQNFKKFRSAQAGAIFKGAEVGDGAYTKVADLRVDGYQAVKVIYEYRQQRDTESEPELPLPPMYAVMVYIEKGADIWEVASYAWNKDSQQKSVPTFEVILRTLKF